MRFVRKNNIKKLAISNVDVSSTDPVFSSSEIIILSNILMHSTKQTTAEIVLCIIEGLAAKSYNIQALR